LIYVACWMLIGWCFLCYLFNLFLADKTFFVFWQTNVILTLCALQKRKTQIECKCFSKLGKITKNGNIITLVTFLRLFKLLVCNLNFQPWKIWLELGKIIYLPFLIKEYYFKLFTKNRGGVVFYLHGWLHTEIKIKCFIISPWRIWLYTYR
jgi:hypothetical protein